MTMARIGRYAGSIVVEHEGKQILVGNPKEPCAVADTLAEPWTLPLADELPLSGCVLTVEHDDLAALARLVADKLVIARNGSVSERLWRVVTNQQASGELRAQWLVEIPQPVWNLVREAMLKCS
jgi:hypothetical protein